jgi:hypothetical protein
MDRRAPPQPRKRRTSGSLFFGNFKHGCIQDALSDGCETQEELEVSKALFQAYVQNEVVHHLGNPMFETYLSFTKVTSRCTRRSILEAKDLRQF